MADKYIYDFREQTDLFREQAKIRIPESKNFDKDVNNLTPEQREAWMIDILNRYGEEGWRFVTIIMNSRGLPLYVFEKKAVKGKE